MGSLESAYAIKTRNLVKLSEQQVCDCSGKGSCSQNTNGGFENEALDWYASHDACSRSSYPFRGRDGNCKRNCDVAVPSGTVQSVQKIQGNKNAFKSALNGQPFSMALRTNDIDQFYGKGVLQAGCSG